MCGEEPCSPDNLIHGVKYEGVAPHDYSHSVIAIHETVRANEKTLRPGEYPNAQDAKKIDEITQIGKKVVISLLVIGIVADRHEVEQLDGIPYRKELGTRADQVTGDEDIQDGGEEGSFLSSGDGRLCIPTFV